MSTVDKTIDMTPRTGMDLRSLSKDGGVPFIQNVIPRNGELAVRPGFGLVRQYGTTLNAFRQGRPIAYGLLPCIGAVRIKTPWNTDQILAIHPVHAFGANVPDTAVVCTTGRLNKEVYGISAVIHDLHTGRMLEVVGHEQDATDDDLRGVFPHYATRWNEEHLRWSAYTRRPQWAAFAQTSGNVVVAVDGMGLWTYRPVEFFANIDRKSTSFASELLPYGPGEVSCFAPLNLCDGAYASDDVFYVRQVEFGAVTAMCEFNGRVVYAVGNVLWFSDPNRPDNILANSFQVMPSPEPVTCLAHVGDVIFAATASSCWVLQPNVGASGMGVSLTTLSTSIGCVSPRSFVAADDGVFFADESGVAVYRGGANIESLSDEIDRLWTDRQSLQMALTDYYTASGAVNLGSNQLPARIDVREQMAASRLTWHPETQTLYCVCDDVTLCWTAQFGWHVWTFQVHSSVLRAGSPSVLGEQHVLCPVFVPVNDDLYLIGGIDEVVFVFDHAGAPESVVDQSCYLLKLGRGGALDRSADVEIEDEREPTGGWLRRFGNALVAGSPALYIGNPVVVPAGFLPPSYVPGLELAVDSYWFPVLVDSSFVNAGGAYTGIDGISLRFTFDNTIWEPVLNVTIGYPDATIDIILPNERMGSIEGWDLPAGVVGTARIFDSVGGVADPAGDQVRLYFDGTAVVVPSWTSHPQINAGTIGPQPFVWLGFTRKTPDTTTTNGIVVDATVAQVNFPGGPVNAFLYEWCRMVFPTQQTALAALSQPVDWAVKTFEAYERGMQIKVRGVFIEAVHLGKQSGDDAINTSWIYGPLNTATSTDMRDYSAQTIDFAANPPGNSEQRAILPMPRLQPSPTSPLVLKVANGMATWGASGGSAGNLLIDDAAVDTLATSDGSQGERASVLVHGTLCAPGEGVRVGKVETVIRAVGNRRRLK